MCVTDAIVRVTLPESVLKTAVVVVVVVVDTVGIVIVEVDEIGMAGEIEIMDAIVMVEEEATTVAEMAATSVVAEVIWLVIAERLIAATNVMVLVTWLVIALKKLLVTIVASLDM
jgi:hypothetical protein